MFNIIVAILGILFAIFGQYYFPDISPYMVCGFLSGWVLADGTSKLKK